MLNIILLGLTSLLADFSSEMIMPILPFFIASFGGGGIAIGLIFGIGDAVAAILKVISGYWADKTKRYKTFVFGGYAFSALAKFLYPLASGWSQVAVIRPIERMGKGFRDAPRDAIVSESLPDGNRGRGFGIQRAMDSIGAIIGSVFVLILFVFFNISFKTLFLISAIIALAAVIPILFVKVPKELKLAVKSVSLKKLNPKAKKFIIIATMFALANFSYAFFILKAQRTFMGLGSNQTLALAILLYIFLNIFDAVFSVPAGILSDKIGRRKVIFIGYLLFSVVSFGFMIISKVSFNNLSGFGILLALFALYGLFKAFIDASQRAFISDLSESEIRGTALGTLETLTGLAAIPAGMIAGFLWNFNAIYTFSFGFTVSFAAACWLMIAIKER
ncbi:MAG: Major facilitator superfamily [Candidatus Yanofskybacteria bacterium GW2011_GWA2_41_22]|uniref:Major facilitator superfamily (MFS) profile domain-containing protein n=4 Tax=Candidatus Yanofskyibacteriota TaxID=1752733 RepID=A0A1F8HQB9_9BACT|nr:MAG: Major facilitator superfamily [Candidatus Yanofskybacteria bacterium GW2011_GWA2_41_22]KKS27403.1 MAG: Major facilitator superfamily [Candidatus Yanofskybacteria bacterium GW2011_GWC2_41_9]OGM99934.1 MAG: hypothetical protein A2736_03145 [Candidatus Yanofskybacteria bacterium RIFCSPHIGHO2_01_FULL_41_27]OGN10177.1 MAG: hypothetical protein A3C64_02605 [Candidatus Yanofskybacteria bacterium RIFCSPHIGHO2_02_FULL_41_12]OGN20817.1 MAG: hypothetical protein A3B00_00595 [Candidatus Yanofskybac